MSLTHEATETIAEAMSEQPLMVRPETTVEEAFALMEEHGLRPCLVVGEEGDLRGVVSPLDLLRVLRPSRELRVLNADQVARLPVREVMRRGVVTAEPEHPLVAAVDLFLETRLHALPVVRRGAGQPMVVGIVTQADALRCLMRGAARTP